MKERERGCEREKGETYWGRQRGWGDRERRERERRSEMVRCLQILQGPH